jgi:hypothetical protein
MPVMGGGGGGGGVGHIHLNKHLYSVSLLGRLLVVHGLLFY